jgi:hypothetical protein
MSVLSKRSYVATAVFNNSFYSYTSSLNTSNQYVYSLVANPLATASNCKAGHILTENGRKLVPGANPGVTTYLVGVYDPSSTLSGFIDPNSSVFAPYNTDLPNYLPRGVDPNLVVGPDGTTNDMGPSVFTSGSVTAQGNLVTSGKLIVPATVVATSAALVAGTLTVATTAVTASSKIFLTHATAGGTQGFLRVSAIVAGTSFTITSSSNTDTSTVNWFIVN